MRGSVEQTGKINRRVTAEKPVLGLLLREDDWLLPMLAAHPVRDTTLTCNKFWCHVSNK